MMSNLNTINFYNSPLDQFEIKSLVNLISPIIDSLPWSINHITNFTNFSLFAILGLLTTIGLTTLTTNNLKIIPSKWSISIEALYATILDMVYSQIGGKKGQSYFPFIFSIFILIIVFNYTSMIAYSFAVTSHLIYTIGASVALFLGYTILGFQVHKLKFWGLLVPLGCPLALAPLLVFIELLSYSARSISLGLRLGANILAGHLLMAIFSSFIFDAMSGGIILFVISFLPLSIFLGIYTLDMAIAFIQGYVFSILLCSYIKEALYLH